MSDKGVDIHFGDLGVISNQIGQTDQASLDLLQIRLRPSAKTGEEPIALRLANHALDLPSSNRGNTERNILKNLYENAARSEHQEGAEDRISRHPKNNLLARDAIFWTTTPRMSAPES